MRLEPRPLAPVDRPDDRFERLEPETAAEAHGPERVAPADPLARKPGVRLATNEVEDASLDVLAEVEADAPCEGQAQLAVGAAPQPDDAQEAGVDVPPETNVSGGLVEEVRAAEWDVADQRHVEARVARGRDGGAARGLP